MANDIRLIPFSPDHVRQTYDWVLQPELRRTFLMRGEITWEGHTAYFSRVLADATQRVYAILSDERHVGNCGYKNINPVQREGELWIYIGEEQNRGGGVGNRAVRLLIDRGFTELGLQTIVLHVPDFNERARRLYHRFGFVEALQPQQTADWTDRGCRIIRMELKRLP